MSKMLSRGIKKLFCGGVAVTTTVLLVLFYHNYFYKMGRPINFIKQQDGDQHEDKMPASLAIYDVNSTWNSNELFHNFNNETGVSFDIIPNKVHFVLFGQSAQLDFTSFLCILSVIKVHCPKSVTLHTDTPFVLYNNTNARYISILRETSRALNVSLLIRHLSRPSHVFGQRLSSVWHAADVAKINLLRQVGGLVLDKDMLVLKPLHQFRKFEMVLGWPEDQFIGTQLLMAHPKARLLKSWLEGYRRYRPTMWYYNAAQLPTQLLLAAHPELVHRETWRLGVHNLASQLYDTEPWPEWTDYYAVHLLSRHKYLRKGPHSAVPNDIDFDEYTIQDFAAPFGEIARHILHKVLPALPPPTKWI